jgi:predicted alpha/beta-hydrolase family hydrolase
MRPPSSPPGGLLFLFAHGAGASSQSSWMKAWHERLSALGSVVSFDYPYMREGRRTPDRLPHLVTAHRQALGTAAAGHEGPVVLAGKSMGSRVGCHVALEEPSVRGLVCFGYPLKGAGKRQALRDEVLLELRVPILFLQGSRDPLCPLDQLEGVRAKMRARSSLHVVEGGDHSLSVSAAARKASGQTQADSDARVLAAVAEFVKTALA